MEHQFNVELATKVGVEKAVIIHNMYFWINHNAKNKKNVYDGSVWTYNSSSAFGKLFPYLKDRTISRYLLELEKDGYLKTGNYNDNTFDKTKWYSFTDNFLEELKNIGFDIEDILISQNMYTDTHKMANRSTDNGEPIPDSKHTDGKQDDKEERDKSLSKKDELFEECWIAYRRKGKKGKAKTYWDKLKEDERGKVLQHIKPYVSVNELRYQQDFERYLRDKTFESIVVKGNIIVYDPSLGEDATYHPFGNNNIMWNDLYNCWLSIDDFNGSVIDGYNDDNRPDGAEIVLHNARGTITWSKKNKKWNIEMKSPW